MFTFAAALGKIEGFEPGDSLSFRAIRKAVEFELRPSHSFELARDRAQPAEQRTVIERSYDAGLVHPHELEEQCRAHLGRETVEFSADYYGLLATG